MARSIWNYIRTALFYLLGIMNTVLIKPEDIGSMKHILGFIFLVLAIISTFFIMKNLLMHRARKEVK